MKCKHLSNVVRCVVQTVKHVQQHCCPNTLWLCVVRRAHITVRNQKNFEECNKICTAAEGWPCLGQQLSMIITISRSAYFNILLSISIKQGLKYPHFIPFFFLLVHKLIPQLQWTQSNARKFKGFLSVDLQAGFVPTCQNLVLF